TVRPGEHESEVRRHGGSPLAALRAGDHDRLQRLTGALVKQIRSQPAERLEQTGVRRDEQYAGTSPGTRDNSEDRDPCCAPDGPRGIEAIVQILDEEGEPDGADEADTQSQSQVQQLVGRARALGGY